MKNTICFLIVIVFVTGCQKKGRIDNHSNSYAGKTSPMVITAAVTITSDSVISGGTVSTIGGGNNVTERGICYNTSTNPTISDSKVPSGSGFGDFVSILSGLVENTTYYVRAYALESTGATYGNQIEFTTPFDFGMMTDPDGNVYKTIKIGSQVWMAGNLRSKKYRNGTLIPNVSDDTAWAALNTGAYCNYDNDEANVITCGRLYNWYAATDTNNIAPIGWHVPSYEEWQTLANYLGGSDIAGGAIKEAGLAHWQSPNTGATNSSGFTALPGGARYILYSVGSCNPVSPAVFWHLGQNGVWWSTTLGADAISARFIETEYNSTRFYRIGFLGCVGYYDRRTGYSIRLIKD